MAWDVSLIYMSVKENEYQNLLYLISEGDFRERTLGALGSLKLSSRSRQGKSSHAPQVIQCQLRCVQINSGQARPHTMQIGGLCLADRLSAGPTTAGAGLAQTGG